MTGQRQDTAPARPPGGPTIASGSRPTMIHDTQIHDPQEEMQP